MAVEVNDLALLFMGTDPKMHCEVINRKGLKLYRGRIETLLYSDDVLLKKIGECDIESLCFYGGESEDYEEETLKIKVNIEQT